MFRNIKTHIMFLIGSIEVQNNISFARIHLVRRLATSGSASLSDECQLSNIYSRSRNVNEKDAFFVTIDAYHTYDSNVNEPVFVCDKLFHFKLVLRIRL